MNQITDHIQGYIDEIEGYVKTEKMLKYDKIRNEHIVSFLRMIKKEIIELKLTQTCK